MNVSLIPSQFHIPLKQVLQITKKIDKQMARLLNSHIPKTGIPDGQ